MWVRLSRVSQRSQSIGDYLFKYRYCNMLRLTLLDLAWSCTSRHLCICWIWERWTIVNASELTMLHPEMISLFTATPMDPVFSATLRLSVMDTLSSVIFLWRNVTLKTHHFSSPNPGYSLTCTFSNVAHYGRGEYWMDGFAQSVRELFLKPVGLWKPRHVMVFRCFLLSVWISL